MFSRSRLQIAFRGMYTHFRSGSSCSSNLNRCNIIPLGCCVFFKHSVSLRIKIPYGYAAPTTLFPLYPLMISGAYPFPSWNLSPISPASCFFKPSISFYFSAEKCPALARPLVMPLTALPCSGSIASGSSFAS